MAPLAQAKVNLAAPVVIAGGYVLHKDAFLLEMSKIEPAACEVTIMDCERLHPALREVLRTWSQHPEAKVPEMWVRVLVTMPIPCAPGVVVPVSVECAVKRCRFAVPKTATDGANGAGDGANGTSGANGAVSSTNSADRGA